MNLALAEDSLAAIPGLAEEIARLPLSDIPPLLGLFKTRKERDLIWLETMKALAAFNTTEALDLLGSCNFFASSIWKFREVALGEIVRLGGPDAFNAAIEAGNGIDEILSGLRRTGEKIGVEFMDKRIERGGITELAEIEGWLRVAKDSDTAMHYLRHFLDGDLNDLTNYGIGEFVKLLDVAEAAGALDETIRARAAIIDPIIGAHLYGNRLMQSLSTAIDDPLAMRSLLDEIQNAPSKSEHHRQLHYVAERMGLADDSGGKAFNWLKAYDPGAGGLDVAVSGAAAALRERFVDGSMLMNALREVPQNVALVSEIMKHTPEPSGIPPETLEELRTLVDGDRRLRGHLDMSAEGRKFLGELFLGR